jgi:hypothetical protein
VSRLDKERAKAQDPDIFRHWFKLYKATVQKYKIKLQNQYNIDKKGVMLSYISKVKVIVLAYKRKNYMI